MNSGWTGQAKGYILTYPRVGTLDMYENASYRTSYPLTS